MEFAQLVKECRKGSVTAQKYFYEEYAVQMFLLCRRYVKAEEISEELMLNGFLSFFTGLSRFEYINEAATIGWLKRIMVNECLGYIRKKKPFLTVAEEHATEVGVEEEAVSNLSAAEILQLIEQLPIGYRTVFNLYAIEGLNHKEIASMLGIAEGTSKSQLSKARQMLQQMLMAKDQQYAERQVK